MELQTLKIAEVSNITYIIQYQPSRGGKQGYWQVVRVTENDSHFIIEIANSGNNQGKDIDFALDNYQTLNYNFLKDL